MRRTACPGNNNLHPALVGRSRELKHALRGTVRRDDRQLEWQPEFLQDVCRLPHNWEIGIRSHDNTNHDQDRLYFKINASADEFLRLGFLHFVVNLTVKPVKPGRTVRDMFLDTYFFEDPHF